jgi:methyl-accepting chemotaxis protein
MNNLSKDEFQSYRQYLTERLDAIEQALTGGGTFADELNDISNQLNAIVISLNNYYRKGEQMRIADLPDNVASKDYVNNRTKGILYGQVTAPPIIDEVVEARDGDVILKTQIQRYSKKVNLITDINALTSGEIDNTRVEPPDHNDTTNRDATDCHPIGAIKDLTTTLSGKVSIETAPTDINSTMDETTIAKEHLEPHDHNDLTSRDAEGCHSISSITYLAETIQGLSDDVGSAIEAAADCKQFIEDASTTAQQYGYTDFWPMIQCLMNAMQNLLTSHPNDKPNCWT